MIMQITLLLVLQVILIMGWAISFNIRSVFGCIICSMWFGYNISCIFQLLTG